MTAGNKSRVSHLSECKEKSDNDLTSGHYLTLSWGEGSNMATSAQSARYCSANNLRVPLFNHTVFRLLVFTG